MPTIQQLISSERKSLKRKTKSPALKSCPERRGVCTRVYTSTPKKPRAAEQTNTAAINKGDRNKKKAPQCLSFANLKA